MCITHLNLFSKEEKMKDAFNDVRTSNERGNFQQRGTQKSKVTKISNCHLTSFE